MPKKKTRGVHCLLILTIDGTVLLDEVDIKTPRLNAVPNMVAENANVINLDSATIINNITIGKARIMTGDIGGERRQARIARKTTIAKNKFGGDVQIMTGNMNGQAAADFNENFWN
jgi:hypothetical protein